MSRPPFALQPPAREYYPAHQPRHDPDPSQGPRPAPLSTTTAPSATSRRRGDDEDDAEADADASSSLLADLRYQVEFYFSDKNLRHDAYLRSLLSSRDHPGMVPVATIASFPRVRKIYAMHGAGGGEGGKRGRYRYLRPDETTAPADPAAVVRSLRNSTVVQVSDDGHWLRPCGGAGLPPSTTIDDWGGILEPSGRGPKDFRRIPPAAAEGGHGPALSVSVDTKATSTLSSTTTSPSVTPTSFDSGGGGADAAVFAGSSSSNQFSEGGAVATTTAQPPRLADAVPSTVSMTTTTPRRGNSSAVPTAQAEATSVPMLSHPYLGTQQQHQLQPQPQPQPQQFGPVLTAAAAYPPSVVAAAGAYPGVAAGAYPGVPVAYLYPPPPLPPPAPGTAAQAQPFAPAPQAHSPPQPHASSPTLLQQGYAVPYPAPSVSHPPQQGYFAASPTVMADGAAAMAAAVYLQFPPQAAAEREWAIHPQQPQHGLGPYEPHPYDPPGHGYGAVAVPVDGYHFYYTHPMYPPQGGPTTFAAVVPPPPQEAAAWYDGPAVMTATTSAEGGSEGSATYRDDSSHDPSPSPPAASPSVGSGSWKQPRRPHCRTKRLDKKSEDAAAAAAAAASTEESKAVVGPKVASHAQRPDKYNKKFPPSNSAIDRSNGSVTSVTSHSTATVLEESSRILPPIASIVGNATPTKGGKPKSPGKKKGNGGNPGTNNGKNKVGASSLLSEENFPALASPKGKAGLTAGDVPGAAAQDERKASMSSPPPSRPGPPLPYAEAAKAKKRHYHPKHKKSDSPSPRNATADDVTRDMLGLSAQD